MSAKVRYSATRVGKDAIYEYPPRMTWADKILELEAENEHLKYKLELGKINKIMLNATLTNLQKENKELREKKGLLEIVGMNSKIYRRKNE